MDVKYATTLIRSWIARRETKGAAVSADLIWQRIREKWPRGEEWQQEAVFQAI